MRPPRRARPLLTALAAGLPIALVAMPGAGRAQDAPTSYTDGAAQLLVRVGQPSLTSFVLTEGTRDATAGRLTLSYRQVDGDATLTVMTPDLAGAHASSPRPPRGAAVTYRRLDGKAGARAVCTIIWSDLTPSLLAGSLSCPRERSTGRGRAPYAIVGTFNARAVPDDGVITDVPIPVYPAGTPVQVEGQTVSVLGVTDVTAGCVKGRAAGIDAGPCPEAHLPLEAPLRMVAVNACVSDGGSALPVIDRRGASRTLFAGEPGALLPAGLPVAIVDPTVTTRAMPRVVNPGSCREGHLVTGTAGPLVVWMPADGAPPVGWTVDPIALPPTAEAPGPRPDGSPAPGASVPPAASVTFTSGAADLVSDGAELVAVDDLVLEEGSYVSDGASVSVLQLRFGSDSATLTLTMPGPDGSFAWAAGAAVANQGVGYTIGDLSVDAGLTGCQVDVASTESGGVSGSYACLLQAGGSASGAFIANP